MLSSTTSAYSGWREMNAAANGQVVGRARAEFPKERLLTPGARDGSYVVHSDDGSVEYRFSAAVLALDHWEIDPDSIARRRGDDDLPLDALEFCIELRTTLGLSDAVLPNVGFRPAFTP